MRCEACGFFRVLSAGGRCFTGTLWLTLICSVGAAGILASPQLAAQKHSATTKAANSARYRANRGAANCGSKPRNSDETSELFFEGYIPYNTFKFAGGEVDSTIFNGGVEYDQQNLGSCSTLLGRFLDAPARLMHARFAYVAEILPLSLLLQPAVTDKWGDGLTPARIFVPGIAIAPVGFRWIWLEGRAIRPHWVVKVGEAVFAQKALAKNASYENFTINSSVGFQARLTAHTDLRLAFEFYHVSNAGVVASNPGLDTLGPNFGIVYHLRKYNKWW